MSGSRHESDGAFNEHAEPAKRLYGGYKGNGDPDGTWWLSAIRRGIEYRKTTAFEPKWETWRRYYRGDYDIGILPENVFFKMVRTLVPRVYFRNPSVSIGAAKPGDDHYVLAQILERIDNKLIVNMKVKQQIKMMTQNAFMFGTGIGKLGYGAEYTPTPDFLSAEAPNSDSRHKDHRIEYNDLVTPNMPWFLSTHPGAFVVPVGATDLHSCRWVAHWIKRHIDDVRDDPRLKHTGDINVSKSYWSEVNRGARPNQEGMVDMVEIRDKKSGMVFILAPYHSHKILYQDHDEMMDEGKFPFFPLIFNADDLFFWGVPDAQILEPQQREMNEIRTTMMKHRRISLIKMLVKRDSLTPDDMERLGGEGIGPAINIDGSVADVRVLEAANIPQGLMTMDALVERDIEQILGMGSNQFGEYAPGSSDRSATEANIVNQATQIRMDERRDAVADLLVDLINQVHPIIFNRWTEEQVIDLVGPGGVKIWVEFKPEELKHGGYNVTIDPDSTLPETKAVKESKAMQVYAALKTNPLIEPHKLTNYLLRQFHGAEFDDMMISPEEAQQMQMQKAAQANGTPGLAKGNPMNTKQYASMLPHLRAIQGGQGNTPQK